MDWRQFRVQCPIKTVPDDIYYIPNFVTKEEEQQLLTRVYEAPKPKWTVLSNRRLQNWGGFPHPKVTIGEPLPQWLKMYTRKLQEMDLFDGKEPNHVLVNEYLSGQGIMAHEDGPLFFPTISTISLGSHAVLYLNPKDGSGDEKEAISLFIEPRSLLIIKKTAYTSYLHGIEEINEDTVSAKIVNSHLLKDFKEGEKYTRGTRISMTIRFVGNMRQDLCNLLGRRIKK